MAGRIFLRVLFALVLLASVGGLGVYVYNSGVAQGMLASGQAAAPAGSAQVAPYAAPYFYRPWGFGWGFFGWVIPALIGFFIVSVLVRMLIFGSFRSRARARLTPGAGAGTALRAVKCRRWWPSGTASCTRHHLRPESK